MISVSQVRAARALIGWKQSELAKASGVSVPAIARLERMTGNPRVSTLSAIQKTFERHGVEFFGDTGVDLRKTIFRTDVLDGADSMQRIWDDVVETLRGTNGKLYMSSIDERVWYKFFGDKVSDEMRRRFRLGILPQLLIREGDNLCLGSDDVYRCVPEAVFGQSPYLVYGDRYALISWKPMRIVLIRNQSIADTFRRQFEFNWMHGKDVRNPKVLNPLMNPLPKRH